MAVRLPTTMPQISFKNLGKINIDRYLRKENLVQLYWIIKLACVSLMVLFALITLRALVKSRIEISTKISELDNQMKANAGTDDGLKKKHLSEAEFGKLALKKEVFGPLGLPSPTPGASQAPPPSSLSLSLIGTYIGSGKNIYAIIEDKNSKLQSVYVKDQEIQAGVKLVSIYKDKIEVLRNGSIEVLALEGAVLKGSGAMESKDGVTALSETEFIVDSAELDKQLDNMPMLISQARAVPYFKDGRATGLRLFAIKAGSFYDKIGLKNGDVLKNINGNVITDLSQAFQLFERLREDRSISVQMERNSADKEFKYQIR